MIRNSGIFYQELRKNSVQVQELTEKDGASISKLSDAAGTLVWLSGQAEKEGLLWLEEAAESERVSRLVLGNELKRIVLLIVTGMDIEIVEDISMKRYFARNYTGLEGVLYLVYLDGALNIYAGVPSYIFRQSVVSLMPEQVNEEMDRMLEKEKKVKAKTAEDRWSALFKSTLKTGDNPEYYIIRLLDHCLAAINDNDMQRLLQDVDNQDMAVAMKLLGGEAYQKIHDNISIRLRTMLIDDLEYMGPVLLKDVAAADSKIFQIILKLGQMREISVPENLGQIFSACETVRDHEKEDLPAGHIV